MGLMNKLRDMFTEEVEVPEETIKKEVIQVEIPAPQQNSEEKVEAPVKEEKVAAPIFFDDKDFAGLDVPKKSEKTSKKGLQKSGLLEKTKKSETQKDERKVFKPSPVISPIYGILDKNYHKEDVKPRRVSSGTAYYNHKDVSIDDIRKKAYGTLEDDLEVTLFGEPEEIEVEQESGMDMFDELLEADGNNSKSSNNVDSSETDDSDLFNLIDSMYDKGDDDNGVR
jgi:hypothetical protein